MTMEPQLVFADRLGGYYVQEMGFPPAAGRVIGYLAVCDPAARRRNQVNDLEHAARTRKWTLCEQPARRA